MDAILFIVQDMFEQGLIWAILALGVFIAYRVEDIADLGAEGVFPLGAAVTVVCLNAGIPPIVSILIAVLAGGLAGLITALLHTALKIPSLLAGIVTMVGMYSVVLRILGQANVAIQRDVTRIFAFWQTLVGNKYWGIMITMVLVIVALFFILYWFFGTELGCAVRATGQNKAMAKAQGIHTSVMIVIGLVIANALVALSGSFYAQQAGYADVGMGRGTIVVGLAAIFLGEVVFGRRSFRNHLLSVICGGFVYFLVIDIALSLKMNANDLKLLQAAIIVVMISWPYIAKGFMAKIGRPVSAFLNRLFRPRKEAE